MADFDPQGYRFPSLLEKIALASLGDETLVQEALWQIALAAPGFADADIETQAFALFEVASIYITGDDNPFDRSLNKDRRQKTYDALLARLRRHYHRTAIR
jgi:hypothetical protein